MLWFAQGSTSCRKHFRPPPSCLRSAATTRASQPSKTAGIGCSAGRDLILDQRGADSASGLLCRDYKGTEADWLVTRIDPGVVSLVAELRGHERQAAVPFPLQVATLSGDSAQ